MQALGSHQQTDEPRNNVIAASKFTGRRLKIWVPANHPFVMKCKNDLTNFWDASILRSHHLPGHATWKVYQEILPNLGLPNGSQPTILDLRSLVVSLRKDVYHEDEAYTCERKLLYKCLVLPMMVQYERKRCESTGIPPVFV